MPRCGTQVMICDLPIRFDTYKGCGFACKYCFVNRKKDISDVKNGESWKALKGFIYGKRGPEVNWCDWKIPIHWGGCSDPFQPTEKTSKRSLKSLQYLADEAPTYPMVISTKSVMIVEDEYLDLIRKCNIVFQISMTSPKLDILESKAPSFNERLKMLEKLVPACRRVIIRVQPYFLEEKEAVLGYLEKYKELGVHGITIEGIKFQDIKDKANLVKVGSDVCYPKDVLLKDFLEIKKRCHELGLAFYCAENRLRDLSDDLCCCGISGLDDFKPNRYNLNHYLFDFKKCKPTKHMNETIYGNGCFAAYEQTTEFYDGIKQMPFGQLMKLALNDIGYIKQLLQKE